MLEGRGGPQQREPVFVAATVKKINGMKITFPRLIGLRYINHRVNGGRHDKMTYSTIKVDGRLVEVVSPTEQLS